MEILFDFLIKFLNIMSKLKSKATLILQEKVVKFELDHKKEVLDECILTLEIFLVKYMHIFILVSTNDIFSTITKNT